MSILSIITINLNNAEGLKKTICSVINQTYTDIDYIVIDGGSTDDSIDVIRQYADKISYWVSEPDRGIFNAMNKGILKARGEYCQFLNSGDWLAALDVTERMFKDMSECSILYGNLIQTGRGKNVINRSFKGKPITLLDMYLSTINHQSSYIKRSLFEKYGLYDETLKIVSDWKFFFITVGLHNEFVAYRDIEVSVFDMNGISNLNLDLVRNERKYVTEHLVNSNMLIDLKECASFRDIFRRLNKYSFIWCLIRAINVVIRKCEKSFNQK